MGAGSCTVVGWGLVPQLSSRNVDLMVGMPLAVTLVCLSLHKFEKTIDRELSHFILFQNTMTNVKFALKLIQLLTVSN